MVEYIGGLRQSDEASISERVVATVADACDVDPLELPPLHKAIDPDALDQLYRRGFAGQEDGHVRVSFTMADCDVVVRGDGEVTVTVSGDRTSPSSPAFTADGQGEADSTFD